MPEVLLLLQQKCNHCLKGRLTCPFLSHINMHGVCLQLILKTNNGISQNVLNYFSANSKCEFCPKTFYERNLFYGHARKHHMVIFLHGLLVTLLAFYSDNPSSNPLADLGNKQMLK